MKIKLLRALNAISRIVIFCSALMLSVCSLSIMANIKTVTINETNDIKGCVVSVITMIVFTIIWSLTLKYVPEDDYNDLGA